MRTAEATLASGAALEPRPVEERLSTFQRFALVVTGALAVRLAFLIAWTIVNPAFRARPYFGVGEMHHIAENLFNHRGFSSPFWMGSDPTAWECPAVPFLWAEVMKLMGEANGHTAVVLFYVQALASALAVGFYWFIMKHVAAKMSAVSPKAPFAAALIFALWPESVWHLTSLWYFVWQELGVAVLVYVAILWCERPTKRTAAALGAATGAVALINVTPVAIGLTAFAIPVLRKDGLAGALRPALLGCVTALLVVAPWLVRDYLALGTFVPLRSNMGFELFMGNNPNGDIELQTSSPHPGPDPVESERYRVLGEARYVKESRSRAFAYIREHPGTTAVRIVERFYVAWCTDLLDSWPWEPGDRWWREPFRVQWRRASVILCALIPLGIVVTGIFRGRFRDLPYRPLFASILLFLPLPNYFTIADPDYMQTLRSWIAFLAIVVVMREGLKPRAR